MIDGLYMFAKNWSKKGSVWIISDTHFDDPDRPFMGYTISEKEQVNIIKKFVTRTDTLVHLGDVGNPEYMKNIKGYKVLILGNHDSTKTKFKPYFDEIYEAPLIISRKIILSHEPVYVPWAFNIHGHIHNPDFDCNDKYHLNLAMNIFGYKPANLHELIKKGIVSKIDDIHKITADNAKRNTVRPKSCPLRESGHIDTDKTEILSEKR